MNTATDSKSNDSMTPECEQRRVDDLAAMNDNVFVRHNATIDDDGLANFLSGASVQGRADQGSYEIIFGFSDDCDDFMVVKNKTAGGLHSVFSQ